jgi:hypothetical protein
MVETDRPRPQVMDSGRHLAVAAGGSTDGQGAMPARCWSMSRAKSVARYDKLHLFDVDVADNRGRYRESDDYAYGSGVVVADTPVGKLGLTVCYDLRFPGAVQRIARCRCGVDYRTIGLYCGDRRCALGCADSRAGHRDPVLCARRRAGRDASRTARNLRPCGDYRPVGPRAGAVRIKARPCCWPNATVLNKRPSGRECR